MRSSETSLAANMSTQHRNPVNDDPHFYCYENLKSYFKEQMFCK